MIFGSGMRASMACLFALVLNLAGPAVRADVTLNLQDADIAALISTVSEITGRNFVVDPRVKGKVTVVSARPLSEEEVYQVFLSVLRVHGFVTVPAGAVDKIVPEASGRSDSVPTATLAEPGSGDELVTRVVEIKHVAADKLVPVLRPLVPQQGHLAAYPPSNALIVSDRAANVERLVKIINRIDVASSSGIEIIRLAYASAGEVVRILSALQATAQQGAVGVQAPKLVADERTNSVLVSADQTSILKLRAVIAHLDTPLDADGNTHVVYLRYANATEIVPILEGVSGTIRVEGEEGQPVAAPSGQDVSIQADEATNAVVISASPSVVRALKAVVRQLDIRRAQVLVEGVIAEISSDKAAELGIQWRATTNPDDSGVIGGTNFSGTGIAELSANPLAIGSGLTLGYLDGVINFRGQEILNIGVLIRALASDSSTNILSTPSLVTLDNQEAEIVVAENVPFLTGQFTNTGADQGATNPFQTIEREDVGLTLKIKPQINEGNTIKLEVEQEVSNLVPRTQAGAAGAVDLITSKRSIKTHVLVDDGNLLVLGGLIDEDFQLTAEKVPLLGDLPLLGRLFRFDSNTKGKRNLMVFLRPQILDARREELLSNAKYNYIRGQQLQSRTKGKALLPRTDEPVLLPLDQYLSSPTGRAPIESADSDESRAPPLPRPADAPARRNFDLNDLR